MDGKGGYQREVGLQGKNTHRMRALSLIIFNFPSLKSNKFRMGGKEGADITHTGIWLPTNEVYRTIVSPPKLANEKGRIIQWVSKNESEIRRTIFNKKKGGIN